MVDRYFQLGLSYFGETRKVPLTFISRDGRPFEISSIDTDSTDIAVELKEDREFIQTAELKFEPTKKGMQQSIVRIAVAASDRNPSFELEIPVFYYGATR